MNTSSRKLTIALALLALLAGSACGQWKVGDKLPPLSKFGLTGTGPVNLAGSQVVLIDFWASWCGPCKKSFPALDALQKTYANRGFRILAINVDDDAAKMEQFMQDHPVSFTVVRDPAQKLVEAAGVEAMPSSFLIDAQGVIRFAHTGFKEESSSVELAQEIESLLGKRAGGTP